MSKFAVKPKKDHPWGFKFQARKDEKKTFSADTRDLAKRAYNGYCWICSERGVDIHHRVPNTVTNNKLYPNLLHSIFNASNLCRNCHDNKKAQLDITPGLARAYEEYLVSLRREFDGKE